MRRSLLVRMLAVSILVAVCSIAATAWLAATTASRGIRQEQSQVLADDSRIYTTLLAYSASHRDWSGVDGTVTKLEKQTGRTITLATRAAPASNDRRASAVIDPLAVDPVIVPDTPADRIDPDAVGPFRLTSAEKTQLADQAEIVIGCLKRRADSAIATALPSGRIRVTTPFSDDYSRCGGRQLDNPTPTEAAALDTLQTLVNECLNRAGDGPVKLGLDFTWAESGAQSASTDAGSADRDDDQTVQDCLASSRKIQLSPYVAPSALLYVTTNGGTDATTFDLSRSNQIRIAGVAAGVLLLAVAVTVLASTRLTRPLRALTRATQRMARGEIASRVTVKGDDEIARLGAAFNEMSEARAGNEALRRTMTSDIAHELRTPLSNIRGWLEAAEDGLSERDPALIASLLEEALLLQHIVDDLQDLAMADAGKLRLAIESVRIADLLAQVRTAHGAHAAVEGIAFTVETMDDPVVDADPLRLRQAIDNLVTNALRHTPAGGTVTVSAREDSYELVIEVADTGIGIAPDDLPHVFDRFWRAEKSRNRRTGGSGLGLSIVRRLAEAHGGTVTASSTVGGGSVFAIRLPLPRRKPTRQAGSS
ncbi:MAG TPA: HAMP domain-containing sensor histidine kinase [Lacisediminihabitans sp.]|uniref:sensor histidine kinase n=1 Tax=Lacisediminihabitans sp. TaxID=2787631 RepID=UPI002ED8231C